MDFTEIYKQSSSLVAFSPGANFLLTAVQDRLIVRRADTLQVTRSWHVDTTPSPTYTALLSSSSSLSSGNLKGKSAVSTAIHTESAPDITHIGWSCDSEYILAASAPKGIVGVFQLRDENWNARVDAGVEGLTKAEWAPDGRTILCFSEWGLRVTVWSLTNRSAVYIQYPVHPDRGYLFRSDGRYFVLAERHRSKDTIGVYDTQESYRLARHFILPTTSLSSISLSPTGNYLAVWEGPLEYKLHVFSLAGQHQGTFAPEPDPGFGIRAVAWHPNGAYLAVGGWDDKIYILDALTWSPSTILELSPRIPPGAVLWCEPTNWLEATHGRGFLSYERSKGPQLLPIPRTESSGKRPYPRTGLIQLDWNQNGSMLMARFENAPAAVYIYDFPQPGDAWAPKLRCVLAHAQPVLSAKWNPVRKGHMAICCGVSSLFTWSDEWVSEDGGEEDMAECIGVPAKNFETRDLRWAPDGKGIILLDKETFCCAFEVEEGAGTGFD